MSAQLCEACQKCGLWENKSSKGYSRLESGWLLQGKPETDVPDVIVLMDSPLSSDCMVGHMGATADYNKFRSIVSQYLSDFNVAVYAAQRCPGNVTRKSWELCLPTFTDAHLQAVKVVISVGKIASWRHTGKRLAEKTIRSTVFKKGDTYYFNLPGPKTVSEEPEVAVYLQSGLSKIRRFLTGELSLENLVNKEARFAGCNYVAIREPEHFKAAVDFLIQQPVLSFDIEATGLSPWAKDARIITLSVAFAEGHSYCFHLHHKDNPYNGQEWMNEEMRRLFSAPTQWVAHNGKFDANWLAVTMGIDLFVHWDTMLMHGALDENNEHGLKSLAMVYTDMGQYEDDIEEYFDGKADRSYENDVPLDVLAQYNCADADVTLRAFWFFLDWLRRDEKLQYYSTLVSEDSYATGLTERNGIAVDDARILEVRAESLERIKEAQERLHSHEVVRTFATKIEQKFKDIGKCFEDNAKLYHSIADRDAGKDPFYDAEWDVKDPRYLALYKWLLDRRYIQKSGKIVKAKTYNRRNCQLNLNSPKHLKEILYSPQFLGLKTDSRTKGGDVAVNKDALKVLAETSPFVKDLLDFRAVQKVYNTYNARYAQGIVEIWDEAKGKMKRVRGYIHDDGLIHCTFLITGGNEFAQKSSDALGGTVTRRKSAIQPNMTNIPKRGPNAGLVQSYFVSRYGKDGVLVQLDYSQLELRIFAINAQAQFMLDAFDNNQDLHFEVATEIFSEKFYRDTLVALQKAMGQSPTLLAQALQNPAVLWREFHTGIVEQLAHKYGIPLELAEKIAKIGSDYRGNTKNVWFGIIYLAGLPTTARQMKLPEEEAKLIMDKVVSLIPEFENYKEQTRSELESQGFVDSMVGARRHLPQYFSTDDRVHAKAHRQACNFKIQNAGSEMLTASWILSHRWLKETGLSRGAHHINSIHDSMLFDCHKDYAPFVIFGARKIMESVHLAPCGYFWFLNPDATAARGVRTTKYKADVETGLVWSKMRGADKPQEWCGGSPYEVFAHYADSEPVRAVEKIVQTLVLKG